MVHNNEQKVKSFWLKSDYVSYNTTPGIPSRIKLPKKKQVLEIIGTKQERSLAPEIKKYLHRQLLHRTGQTRIRLE